MMKGRKIAALLAVGVAASMLLSGCSYSSIMEKIVEFVHGTEETETVVSDSSFSSGLLDRGEVDPSLEVPSITTQPGEEISVLVGQEVILETAASVSDGGTIGYQWYINNVGVNGGGTMIDGAVNPVYQVDTSESGTDYYYVLAINEHGDKINLAASEVYMVTVWDEGSWQQNAETGGYQYMIIDTGDYPVSTTMEIEGETYTFDEDGYVIDENGNYIDVINGGMTLTAKEVEPESVPGEETTEETQEEQPAEENQEEQPAEESAQEEPSENAGDGAEEAAQEAEPVE